MKVNSEITIVLNKKVLPIMIRRNNE